MARQQFYSRVPFKISMFNRADGYDTFACSEGLDREFIEKELAMVCENKPTPEETVLIRKNELPPAYCQYTAKDNSLIQSCTSYFEKDYTGERSTYLVHNIIFSPQETEALFYIQNRAVINPDMFVTDLGQFNITDPNGKPQKKYPLLDYTPLTAEPTSWLTETFDAASLQRFIYASIASVCGNVKSLFFVLPDNDKSRSVIKFLNTFFQIIPYYLRPQLSFATRISDISRFPNVKLKCLQDDISIPAAKGVFLNMKTRVCTGLKDEDIAANRQIVEFFYTLITNDEIRREFLLFSDHAVREVPALGALNLKALGNLIFLFRCSSGMFEENAVLPTDDKLIDFYTIYDKNRPALSHEYRMTAAKSLQRYPREHMAIPGKLFTKITKLYPSEIPGVKHIFLTVFLELIHTDIMRDKLFTFIRNNYADEDEETKVVIIDNLCRVFYGGFLQSQILVFFRQIFPTETPETQNAIIDKLLLAIRNKEVKAQIVTFITESFDSFSPDIKKKFYESTFEHLPDGDELAGELINIVNAHITEESDEEREWYASELYGAITSELKHKKHPLLRLLATKTGWCSDIVMQKMFTEFIGKKPCAEVIECFCTGTYLDLCERLKAVWRVVPDLSEEDADKIIEAIENELQTNPKRPDLKSALAAAKLLNPEEPETPAEDQSGEGAADQDQEFNENDTEDAFTEEEPAKEETAEDKFWEKFADRILTPVISENAADVFRYADGDQLMPIAVAYADSHHAVQSSEKFAILTRYAAIRKSAVTNHPTRFTVLCEGLPEDPMMRKYISAYMKKDLIASGAVSNRSMKLVVEAFVNYLKDGNFGLSKIYDDNRLPPDEQEEQKKKSADKGVVTDPDLKVVTIMLKIANLIAVNAKTEKMREALYSDASGMTMILSGYTQGKKKADLKPLYQVLDALKPENNPFVVYCKKQIEQTPQSSGGGISMPSWLTNLFSKKKK